jgi:hypothetical protein
MFENSGAVEDAYRKVYNSSLSLEFHRKNIV